MKFLKTSVSILLLLVMFICFVLTGFTLSANIASAKKGAAFFTDDETIALLSDSLLENQAPTLKDQLLENELVTKELANYCNGFLQYLYGHGPEYSELDSTTAKEIAYFLLEKNTASYSEESITDLSREVKQIFPPYSVFASECEYRPQLDRIQAVCKSYRIIFVFLDVILLLLLYAVWNSNALLAAAITSGLSGLMTFTAADTIIKLFGGVLWQSKMSMLVLLMGNRPCIILWGFGVLFTAAYLFTRLSRKKQSKSSKKKQLSKTETKTEAAQDTSNYENIGFKQDENGNSEKNIDSLILTDREEFINSSIPEDVSNVVLTQDTSSSSSHIEFDNSEIMNNLDNMIKSLDSVQTDVTTGTDTDAATEEKATADAESDVKNAYEEALSSLFE